MDNRSQLNLIKFHEMTAQVNKQTFLSREQPSRVTNPRLAAVVAAVVDVELCVRELGLGPRVDRSCRVDGHFLRGYVLTVIDL